MPVSKTLKSIGAISLANKAYSSVREGRFHEPRAEKLKSKYMSKKSLITDESTSASEGDAAS